MKAIPVEKNSRTSPIRRAKTSLPVAGLWATAAPFYESAVDIGENRDFPHLRAQAVAWIRMVESWVDGSTPDDARVNGVIALSQPDGIEAMGPVYLAIPSPFWTWYAANGEFVVELCARVIRWRECRGGTLQNRLARFILVTPAIKTSGGRVAPIHRGITNAGNCATDEEIANAFKLKHAKTLDVCAKNISSARQRLFGPTSRYRRDLEKRIDRLKRGTRA